MAKKTTNFKTVFKTLLWPRKTALLIGLFLIIISRLSGMVLPVSLKFFVDDVIPDKNMNLFWLILLLVVVAITIQSITSFILTRLLGIEAHRIIAELRVEVQKKVLGLPVSFFDKNKSGALVQRIMDDVDGVKNIVGTGLVQLIGGLLTSAIALGVLIYISPLLTLYVLAPVILIGLIFLKAFSYIRPLFKQRREVNAAVQGRLVETLGGIRIIKGYNAEKQELKVFNEGVFKIFKFVKKSMTAQALVRSSTTFILGITSAGIMGFGGSMIMDTNLTIGEFMTFTVLLGYLIAPLVQMSNIGTQLTDAFTGLDRIEELMAMAPEEDMNRQKVELNDLNGHLVFNEVSFKYEEGEDVLKHMSFEAKPGTVTALVGSSGAGKSTIAGLVATHLRPGEGVITIDGHDLSEVTLNSYRNQLGLVLQDDFLFEGSIRENILFPRPDSSEEELEQAVQAAHVNEFTDRFENGLDTIVGERGVKLSGGQRQRVSIARAVLAKPKILILDEATSSLDVESEVLIQKSLENLISGRTTIVIAHRLSTIRQADQILVVENGEIIERGSHEDLIEKKGRYHELFTLQARM
jgi:subfamily B ATP-binding cassette protein MsbA